MTTCRPPDFGSVAPGNMLPSYVYDDAAQDFLHVRRFFVEREVAERAAAG